MAFFPLKLGIEELVRVMDSLYDEIWIYDDSYNLLYVNAACERHYGLTQEEILSLSFSDAVNKYKAWTNSVLPLVYKHKKPMRQQQVTFLGGHTLLIANPVFGEKGEITHVVMVNRDCCNEIDLPIAASLGAPEDDVLKLTNEEIEENFEGVNMPAVRDLVHKMAKVSVPCLLLGESGSGKTFLARYIHGHSARARKPFVVLSCPSVPRELFESELFGHVKGAFSGAVSAHQGLFAQAEGGTLLLDEISELPLSMQAKLLHVLQEKEYRPVGSTRTVKTDVRILAATNRNLESMVNHKLFRQDLYFRLNVLDITLPPLRERGLDLDDLIYYYLRRSCKKFDKHVELCEPVLGMLRNHSWPGNIRELKNVMERAVIMAEGQCVEAQHLPLSMFANAHALTSPPPEPGTTAPCLKREHEIDSKMLKNLYVEHNSSRKLAQALGVSQSTASRLIRKYIKAEG